MNPTPALPKVSVLVTTYNAPRMLSLVLKSLQHQTIAPQEVVVADDGSGEETAQVIQRFKKNAPFPVLHAWQEDRGFRAARVRNLAAHHTTAEYLVYIDGDMVLHPRFIEDQQRVAEKNVFVQGSRVLLLKKLSEEKLATQNIQWPGLCTSGLKNRKNLLRSSFLSKKVAQKLFAHAHKIRTCSFSLWREDLIKVNGFDNSYIGWGREDSDFAWRLVHAGVWRRNLRFAALALHLYHEENSRASLPENDARLQHTLTETNYLRCAEGFEQTKIERS